MAAKAKRKPVAKRRPAPKARPLPRFVVASVNLRGDTHVARALDAEASCTWSAREAVRRLATKLGYPASADMQLVSAAAGDSAAWKIVNVEAPRACTECGCTDTRACRGGCHWVTEELCSACSGVSA